MIWTDIVNIIASICFILGSFLAMVAGIGAVRFPNLLSRMHAAAKPQVLGMILLLIGIALRVRSWAAVWVIVLIIMFQLLTAPVAAHMVGKAGYLTGKVRKDRLYVDELTRDLKEVEGGPSRGQIDRRPET